MASPDGMLASMTAHPTATLRPYQPDDLADVHDVCVRTGHAGGDARPVYPDPEILPVVFAAPYVHLEPELAFVVDNGERVVGYILGTADTAAFARRVRAEWLPRVRDRYPAPAGPPSSPAEHIADLLHHPERFVHPELADYPAHLHIDLLPDYQGAGLGRALMRRFLAALAARGVERVHLGMDSANTRAGAFYRRLGFHELPLPGADTVTYFGRSTEPEPATPARG